MRISPLHGAARQPQRRLRDSAIAGEAAVIQFLSGAARRQLNKPLKGRHVADVDNLAHIPFQVGGCVEAKPLRRVQLPVKNARVATGKQCFLQSGKRLRKAQDFPAAERFKFQVVRTNHVDAYCFIRYESFALEYA